MTRKRTILLVLVLAAAPATAGGLRDLADAWLIPAPAVRDLLDAAAPPESGWSLVASRGRLFDLDALPQSGLMLGRHWPRVNCRLRWERLGRSLYREDLARLEVLVGGRWRFGGEAGVDRLALADDPGRAQVVGDVRVQGRLGTALVLDVWWPLTDAPTWHGDQGLRRWLRLVGTGDGWTWAAVVDRRATGEPTFQGEVMLQLAAPAALGLRVEPWSGAAGFCTAWRLGAVLLRTSHLVHPDLGATHRWSLGLGERP